MENRVYCNGFEYSQSHEDSRPNHGGRFPVPLREATGTTVLSLESREFQNRRIWIDQEVDQGSALTVVRKIAELNRQDNRTPIRLLISTAGGNIHYGMLIIDAMRSSAAPVETVAVGDALSMGAVLLAAGEKRYILPHSQVMLHEPLTPGIWGSASDIRAASENLQKAKADMDQLLAELTGHTVEEIQNVTKADHFFNAEEAVTFGLADVVAGMGVLL